MIDYMERDTKQERKARWYRTKRSRADVYRKEHLYIKDIREA